MRGLIHWGESGLADMGLESQLRCVTLPQYWVPWLASTVSFGVFRSVHSSLCTHHSCSAHQHTPNRIHTHTHSCSLILTHTHSHTFTINSYSPTPTHTHSYSLIYSPTPTHTHSYSRIFTHAYSLTLTHIYSQLTHISHKNLFV